MAEIPVSRFLLGPRMATSPPSLFTIPIDPQQTLILSPISIPLKEGKEELEFTDVTTNQSGRVVHGVERSSPELIVGNTGRSILPFASSKNHIFIVCLSTSHLRVGVDLNDRHGLRPV
jgi:hypothetical protein